METSKTQRVLITVKTYPTISSKYIELVCTAGLREDGSWIRIYPVQFRMQPNQQQYGKYDWVEWSLYRRQQDRRPESYSPDDPDGVRITGHIDTKQHWMERREFILGKAHIYQDLSVLIREARENKTSLAVFKPKEVFRFGWNKTNEEWPEAVLQKAKEKLLEQDLFQDNTVRRQFEVAKKIPYDFFYEFIDVNNQRSTMKILDWEIGALFLNCLDRANGDVEIALEKVRQKYWDEFKETDLHFFLGTTLEFHSIAPNPFTIVGVLPIPSEVPDLFSSTT